jgi:two-component system response regulator AtoC
VKQRVLVIDDEPSIARSLTRVLTDRGYEVACAPTGTDGLAKVQSLQPHVVMLDLKLPDGSGFNVLSRIRETESPAKVIVITAFGDTKAAVQAMKAGACDFLHKPYDLDELETAIESAARSSMREAQLTVYRRKDRSNYGRESVVGESEPMARVWDLVDKVARSDAASVLITGESGTGKELVAQALHFESGRRDNPFIELNCSAFQETLIENELFGHERGAFTGASAQKRGLVELADGGTLFLDEVGEMPIQTQAKLLRFLETRAFKRVGGNSDIHVDIRVIAATNVDLAQRIEEGQFRKDLFYRLQVVSIELPPLRERADDVCLLAEHFLRRFTTELRKQFVSIEPAVREALRRYSWPGNVRELRNLVERIVLIEDDATLRLEYLPDEVRHAAGALLEGVERSRRGAEAGDLRTLREVEDEHILRVLTHCKGNKSRAARVLGLSRQGLIDRLKRVKDPSLVG